MCIVICTLLLSRPARGAWVEIFVVAPIFVSCLVSRPARGAWVEILVTADKQIEAAVAPRKGRVG